MNKKFLLVFIVLAQLIAGIAAHAQTTLLFDNNSPWKYLDNGSNQGTTWKDVAFVDATWASGTGHIGYGDTWITTCITAGATCPPPPDCNLSNTCNKYITTYLRKTINIADVSLYDSVRFSVYMDDGVVMYVNGVEVWRNNMPTGTVAYTTLASGNIPESTAVVKSIPISAFTNGNNVIAVEVHQNAATTSDMDFAVQAFGVIRTNIFSLGSSWMYLTTPTDQGTTWRNNPYTETGWLSGTGHIGFGETWTTTCIPAGPTCPTYVTGGPCAATTPGLTALSTCGKYNTAYFRKSVSLPAPSLFDSIRFSAFVDDGMVMYVNGVEVWRTSNLAGAPNAMTYSVIATPQLPESTAVAFSVPISAFTTGTNIIAVEVHQNSSTSSDMDFNVQATGILHVPPPAVTLTRGPYLQMGNKTAVSLRWRTNVASKSRFAVGTVVGTYPIVVNDASALVDHELRVTGLTPNTKYYYRFGTDTSNLQGDTANFFVTAPTDTTARHITIAAYGDCGRNDNSFQTTTLSAYQSFLTSIGMKAADIMILVGDNAYDNGTDAEFQTGFFNTYQGNILKNHIMFPAPGNHDYANDATRQVDHNIPYYTMFTTPTAGECGGVASGTEAYYSYDWGNVHILSLDSYGKENAGSTRLYDTLGAQVTWIKNDLAANTKKWTIAYWHHPPYSMGSHNTDTDPETSNIRQNLLRILERNGVDVIICGHSHDYERSYLLKGHYGTEPSFNKAAHTTDSSSGKYNGTTNSCPYTIPSGHVNHGIVYVVSGSSGADGGVQAGYPHDALPFAIDDGGMFFLDIQDNRLDAKFIRRNNTIADQFTIMKDVKTVDTTTMLYGSSVNLSATWLGTYYWAPGVTTRAATITPTADTLIQVKDNATNTCLTDRHYIDLQCTMPNITSSPADITRDGCHAVVTYAMADTGRPAPFVTYTFAGATTGSGNGTGSGSTFSVGVTTVTLTAANECGSSSRSFTVTILPLPVAYNVTGGGGYCPSGTGVPVGLDNSQTGVNYQLYDGTTPIGSAIAGTGAAISFGIISSVATYSVLATDTTTSCTSPMTGNASVFIHPLPAAYNVTGGGNYCAGAIGVPIGLDNSQPGVNYQLYNGASAIGSAAAGTGAAFSFGSYTATGTYNVVATNTTTTCVNNMSGSATVGINPLPTVYSVTGGGSYCAGGTGVAIGLDNTNTGINYQLYTGSIPVSGIVAGTGTGISFNSYTFAGTYTAMAVDAVTGCSNNMSGSATVSINPLPISNTVSGGGNFCPGGAGVAVGMAASEAGINYQLYMGSTTVGSPVAGTGSPISFGLQTSLGSYTVSATNTVTGCVNDMAGSAVVGNYSLPVIYPVTGGGNYCAGGTGSLIGLGNSQPGVNYQLYNGISTVGSAVAGTGTAFSFGSYTATGTYSVVATNVTTTCLNNMSGSATMGINPLPAVYNVTGGGSYCAGGVGMPIGLNNSDAGITYRLYIGITPVGSNVPGTGAAISFGNIMTANVYTVLATNPVTGCTRNMASSATVVVYPLPTPFSVSGGGNYCSGVTGVPVGLTSSQTGINYQLYNGTTAIGSTVAGTGAGISFGSQTVAGNYTATATNTATGCTSAMIGLAVVGINELPTVYSVTGGGNFCAGGAGMPVGLGGSATGISYQLYNGATTSGTAMSGTGSPLNFGLKTAAGIYSVIATNAVTACVRNMSGTVSVSVTPLVTPSISISSTPGTNVCNGTPVVFTTAVANAGATPTYNWYVNGTAVSSGAASYSYTPLNGDNVLVVLNSSVTCVTAATANDIRIMTVLPNVTPSAHITASPSDSVCEGTPITFTVTPVNGGISPGFTWFKNSLVVGTAPTYSYVPLDNDGLVLSLTSNAPCRTTDNVYSNAISMKVDETYMPAVSISADPGTYIATGQRVTFTAYVTNAGAAPSYKWAVNNSIVPGATTPAFVTSTLSDKDSVTCIVKGSGLCGLSGFNALVMNVTPVGVDGITKGPGAIKVVPNPTTGEFTIEGATGFVNNDKVTISVTDIQGHVVYTANTFAHKGTINERISLGSHLADGMYLLTVNTATGNQVFHIVLKR